MYKLNVTSHFSAAHRLVGYDGACKNIHGHNWKVRVGIVCKSVDEIGLTIDFGIVKKYLDEIMQRFDHKMLNELDCFSQCNPTSEHIAKYIYDAFQEKLKIHPCQIADVEVWESDRSSMIYYE